MSKRVFITVGTTEFNDLIRTIDTKEILKELSSQGYTELIIQIGKGEYIPQYGNELIIKNVKNRIYIRILSQIQ